MYNNNVISDDYFTFLNNLSKLFNVYSANTRVLHK